MPIPLAKGTLDQAAPDPKCPFQPQTMSPVPRGCTVKIEALNFNQSSREIRGYITGVVHIDPVYCITRTARSRTEERR